MHAQSDALATAVAALTVGLAGVAVLTGLSVARRGLTSRPGLTGRPAAALLRLSARASTAVHTVPNGEYELPELPAGPFWYDALPPSAEFTAPPPPAATSRKAFVLLSVEDEPPPPANWPFPALSTRVNRAAEPEAPPAALAPLAFASQIARPPGCVPVFRDPSAPFSPTQICSVEPGLTITSVAVTRLPRPP